MNLKPYPQTSKAAAWLFFLVTPGINGPRLFSTWMEHPVLRDYQQPDQGTLTMWVEEFIAERSAFLYQDKYVRITRKEGYGTS